ncbi:hypothetical protein HIM_06726 [Hirsutella minnesotensis 3608]|uniref:SGF29 C-terminal domain-containing protein n=1 Tax=Hirsutella minnesotensis 3608 TaxID=1043627 RepID=A0A0F7ZTW7_9HYPO|nr:hypothetical protein HIM_06726 [Hirsutella minnesotensis 3608]
MADKHKPQLSRELEKLKEELGPYFHNFQAHRRGAGDSLASGSASASSSSTPVPPQHASGSTTARGTARATGSGNQPASPALPPKKGSASTSAATSKKPVSAQPGYTSAGAQARPSKPSKSSSTRNSPGGAPNPVAMSQRNRSGRGSNRNNGNNSHGEEAQIWDACKAQMNEIVAGINAENDSLGELVELDKRVGAMDPEKIPNDALKQMEQLCRKGVKFSDANVASLKAVMEQLKILRAVVVAKEQAEAASSSSGPSKRAATRDSTAAATAASASLYDFDGGGDSPVPSPIGGGAGGSSASTRKHGSSGGGGDRSSNRDRDSMPPKADSVEPQGPGSGGASGSNNRSRVVFSKGDAVAFKPKAVSGESTSDWILGEVAQVLGEGKSRRYKVLDIEPDDQSKQKEYRSSASNMIAITPESQAATLRDWEAGKIVLALYPNTTTFYKAEVHSMDGDGRVNLKFEGENDSTTLQQVERRFVIEYRA